MVVTVNVWVPTSSFGIITTFPTISAVSPSIFAVNPFAPEVCTVMFESLPYFTLMFSRPMTESILLTVIVAVFVTDTWLSSGTAVTVKVWVPAFRPEIKISLFSSTLTNLSSILAVTLTAP